MSETSIRFYQKDGLIYTEANFEKTEEILKIFDNLTNGKLIPYIQQAIITGLKNSSKEGEIDSTLEAIKEIYTRNLINQLLTTQSYGSIDDEDDDEPLIDPEMVFGHKNEEEQDGI